MLCGALFAASLALTQLQIDRLDAAVADVMQANAIPGLSIGIARKGEVLFLHDYGRAQKTYRIGSITKQFTAALALQEAERGTLPLSTRTHGATVAQLLAQTSGISDTASPVAAGSTWQYSNQNYVLVGTMLESATHDSYATLLDRSILNPLHLRDTSLDSNAGTFAAAAGMRSSTRDLLTWLEALRTGRVVDASDFQSMITSQSLDTGVRTHYGYGFYIRDWYGWKVAEHPGYVDGYSADDALVVDDGLEVAVLSNATNAYLVPLTKTVVSLLEPASDPSLVPDFSHPPENEDAKVRRDVTELAQHLNLGEPSLVEFMGRTTSAGTRYEKYRVSFGSKQFWVTLGYGTDGLIDSLSVDPDEE